MKTLILLGYIFDPENYQASNDNIMQNILEDNNDFISVCVALKPYVGRYALLYRTQNALISYKMHWHYVKFIIVRIKIMSFVLHNQIYWNTLHNQL